MNRFATIAALAAAAVLLSAPPSADAARRLTFEGDFQITAEVQKPEVAVFISRENLHKNYRLELRESFLPRIIESVESAPF